MVKYILVIGKDGQLGQSLYKVANKTPAVVPESDYVFVGRDELDLSSITSISGYFENTPVKFSAILNCAAYTAVDKAESNPELADQINHLALKELSSWAKSLGIPLLHISTDYVFDGRHFQPYRENDPTNPQNVYGLTKLRGEQAIVESGCRAAIIRASWVYSEFGNNFVKTMLRLASERDNLTVINDQIGSPTYAPDLASAMLHVMCNLIEHNTQFSKPEIYHFSNEGVCSWYDFAKSIFEMSGTPCKVSAIETKDYPTPAKRPHYSVLNKGKIKQVPGLTVPYWRDSLKICLKELGITS